MRRMITISNVLESQFAISHRLNENYFGYNIN